MIWAWILFAGVLAVVEMLTLGFAAAFLAVGALAAAAVAGLGGDIVAQAIAFLVVSVLGILAVRPALMRYRKRHAAEIMPSGAEAMIGQKALVAKPGEGGSGWAHVRVAGEDWPAVSTDGHPLHEGQQVEVVALRGTALVVTPVRAHR